MPLLFGGYLLPGSICVSLDPWDHKSGPKGLDLWTQGPGVNSPLSVEENDFSSTESPLPAGAFRGRRYSTEFLDTLVETLCGAGPGDPWADLLFNALFTEVLQRASQEVIQNGLAQEVPYDAKMPFLEQSNNDSLSVFLTSLSFVDDVVVPIFQRMGSSF